jgi:hypothetical protein
LVAATAGLLGQGAYYPSTQRPVGLLIAAATLLALAGRPLAKDDLRLLPVVPALALASWAVLDGALVGVRGAGVGPALLLVGAVAVLLVCRRLRQEDREILLAGVIGIGLLVALTGWLGVAGRAGSWAFQAPGLWRASSTLTSPTQRRLCWRRSVWWCSGAWSRRRVPSRWRWRRPGCWPGWPGR